MAIAHYEWFKYFEFAAAADAASLAIRQQIDAVAPEIEQLGSGMAGNDEAGNQWGSAWDSALNKFLPNACRLADAYGAIANRAYTAGVNFITAEWVASGGKGPAPAPPTKPPEHVDQRVLVGNLPTSIGDNGDPFITDIPGLKEQIGKDLPNGNDVKLRIVGDLLEDLRKVIREHTDEVRKFGREPGRSTPRTRTCFTTSTSAMFSAPRGWPKPMPPHWPARHKHSAVSLSSSAMTCDRPSPT
ncbi:hypothetical protein FEK35_28205 [Nocardia cyriacigeorgica]|uniref:Uncharacterized protein n=1 Tax=Nocardia cyriacigeorgica TaxID=135487 RepID=A0A5R8P843_9NOCA|nr:hypothetical protein [Nocardia cyriacigeorgica]TLF96635.1 hypothetical protein FEK35_28205 [Nocardia cyriacigeorgica]